MSGRVGVIGGGHLGEQLAEILVLAPAAQTGGDKAGAGINRTNFNAMLFEHLVGAHTAGNYVATLQDSDDDGVGDPYVDVDAANLQFGAVTRDIVVGDADSIVRQLADLRKTKTWVRILFVDGGAGNIIFGSSAVMGAAGRTPAVTN